MEVNHYVHFNISNVVIAMICAYSRLVLHACIRLPPHCRWTNPKPPLQQH